MDFLKNVSSSMTKKYNKLVKEEINPDLWQSTKTYKPGDQVKINENSQWYKC